MNPHHRLNRRAFITTTSGASLAALLQGATPETAHKFKLKAAQARAIAMTSDELVVIAADRSLLVHRLSGELVREIGTARPVRAVCGGTNGGLFVTFSDQVAYVNAKGEIQTLGGKLSTSSALTGIAVADDGRIFAADSAQRVIWRMDPHGKVLGQICPQERGFAVPRAFFPISWHGGQLVVAEPGRHQIQRYSADGELVSKWGARSRDAEGFAGCCNPVAIAMAADGSVVTVERGQVRVKRFDAAGSLVRQVAGPEHFAGAIPDDDVGGLFGCEGGLLDVAASHEGQIVVLDRTALEVLVLA
ncbi:MAG TPA: hypothetical protein DDZ88_18195 [Verrucomicrobiales bacterium]|nr:hypothetical protein [Verrucomicrobiales bacterium]